MQFLAQLVLGGSALFLILLVLVQRGRGGGLAGALGGAGGSSAFGAKAGDVFTRITIITATVWILLCIAAAKFGGSSESRFANAAGDGAGITAVGEGEEGEAPAGLSNEDESAEEVAGPDLIPAQSGDSAEAAAASETEK
ncbi:MAG: preprotein translocase subunit SecG [Planctomycetota bacterium]